MTAKVTVQPFGDTLEIDPGESLLDAVLRQGRFAALRLQARRVRDVSGAAWPTGTVASATRRRSR